MERENADMSLLITLEPPTKPMNDEATSAGFYTPEAYPDRHFPRVQIATIEDILTGNGPAIPQLGLSHEPPPSAAPHANVAPRAAPKECCRRVPPTHLRHSRAATRHSRPPTSF